MLYLNILIALLGIFPNSGFTGLSTLIYTYMYACVYIYIIYIGLCVYIYIYI